MFAASNSGRGLALVRLAFGLYFLNSAWNKIAKGWLGSGEAMAATLGKQVERSEAFYRPFLEGVVLSNADLFAKLVALGEAGVGLSLILGLLTPLGALVGAFLMTNFILYKGFGALRAGADWVLFLGFVGLLIGAAGLTWGLDGLLLRARRRDARADDRPATRGRGRATAAVGD